MKGSNKETIAKRLFALRDFIYSRADATHAIRFEEIRAFYYNNRYKDGDNNKMIYSDLNALKKAGIKVEYSEKSKGWLLLNPPFEPNEVRLIIDSVQASKFITQKKAASLTKKITDNFGSGRQKNLNRQAYVYDRIRSQNDEVVSEIERIHEAIAANRKISFRYFHYAPDKDLFQKRRKGDRQPLCPLLEQRQSISERLRRKENALLSCG